MVKNNINCCDDCRHCVKCRTDRGLRRVCSKKTSFIDKDIVLVDADDTCEEFEAHIKNSRREDKCE